MGKTAMESSPQSTTSHLVLRQEDKVGNFKIDEGVRHKFENLEDMKCSTTNFLLLRR